METRQKELNRLLNLARQARYQCSVFAELYGVSLRKLERKFLREYGRTPKEWLNEARQRAGLELLRDGCSVKEAAAVLGYSRAANFSRDFKMFFGMSPSHIANTFKNKN